MKMGRAFSIGTPIHSISLYGCLSYTTSLLNYPHFYTHTSYTQSIRLPYMHIDRRYVMKKDILILLSLSLPRNTSNMILFLFLSTSFPTPIQCPLCIVVPQICSTIPQAAHHKPKYTLRVVVDRYFNCINLIMHAVKLFDRYARLLIIQLK